jgi:serine/threonine protein kinase
MLLSSSEISYGDVLRTTSSGTRILKAEISSPQIRAVAAKVLQSTSPGDSLRVREILSMKINHRHSNFVRIEGVAVDPDSKHLAVLTELSPHGSLEDLLQSRRQQLFLDQDSCDGRSKATSGCFEGLATNLAHVQSWITGVARALLFAHTSASFVHGAVNPSHVLLFDRSVPGDMLAAKLLGVGPTRAAHMEKVSSLGRISALSDDCAAPTKQQQLQQSLSPLSAHRSLPARSSPKGSRFARLAGSAMLCTAPELLAYGDHSEQPPSPACDLFSLGSLILLLLDRHPWSALHPSDILQACSSGMGPLEEHQRQQKQEDEKSRDLSCAPLQEERDLVELALACVRHDPQARPNIQQVIAALESRTGS